MIIKFIITLLAFVWSTLFTFSALILGFITFNRRLPLFLMRTVWAPVYLLLTGIRYKVDYNGVNLDPNKNYVFFANHRSFIDIPVINVVVKRNLYFVLKEELRWTYVIGWFAQYTEMIFVDRSNKVKSAESLKNAGLKVNKGKNVLIFPEGTRSKTADMLALKRGGFEIAHSAGVEIVPIIISGTEKAKPKGQYLFQPAKVYVKLLKPMSLNNKDLSYSEVRRSLGDLMNSEVKKLDKKA